MIIVLGGTTVLAIILSTYKSLQWVALDNLDFFVYRDIMTIRVFLGGLRLWKLSKEHSIDRILREVRIF